MNSKHLKKYYGSKGRYLKEHEDYFSESQLKKDIDFIIDVLKLNKKDKILDLACGHGRHTLELKKRGFDIDGLDLSEHLLRVAKENARRNILKINFYQQDIHNIKLRGKYDKVFLFFSEFGLFDAKKVLKNVRNLLKKGGTFLLDSDNVFRLLQYLIKHPKTPYEFDFIKMELKSKQRKSHSGVRYYTFPELKVIFQSAGLKIVSVYGNYEKEKLSIDSKRIIAIVKR
ncbi:class I SAM-dependent methyltransferase [Candidatus Uhrbacteria bacterium]|nr:class I SAM-dependent methyltransferase [Candidatus Uhrbacteria bacterium]